MEVVAKLQKRAMPHLQPCQATWALRLSMPRCLLKACRSVSQALEHEGKGDAASTEVVAHPRDRAIPQPQPQQAPSEHAAIGCSPTGVPECCSGARARRERRRRRGRRCEQAMGTWGAHVPWQRCGIGVARSLGCPGCSLGVPTWLGGDEGLAAMKLWHGTLLGMPYVARTSGDRVLEQHSGTPSRGTSAHAGLEPFVERPSAL